jgi:hypothetical protein
MGNIIILLIPKTIMQIKSRRMGWVGHVACMGMEIKVYRVLVGKPEGKNALGRPRRRWNNGLKIDLKEISWEGVECIHLAQDRGCWRDFVKTVTNLRATELIT